MRLGVEFLTIDPEEFEELERLEREWEEAVKQDASSGRSEPPPVKSREAEEASE